MADTIGTVQYIKVNNQAAEGQDFCFFGLLPQGGTLTELFILWWALSSGTPSPTAADWVLRNVNMWMLRDAFLNKLTITVTTDDVSALVTKIQLGQS